MSENLPVKKKRRGNPALTGDALNLEPGDNTRAILTILEIDNYPTSIDIKTAEPATIQERCEEYFRRCAEHDFKPLVSGLAGSLEITRRELWSIVNGTPINTKGTMYVISAERANVIKREYQKLEKLMEFYIDNGKINPVSGIFMAKNHFGYTDKQDVTFVATTTNEFDATSIRDRYLTDDSATID